GPGRPAARTIGRAGPAVSRVVSGLPGDPAEGERDRVRRAVAPPRASLPEGAEQGVDQSWPYLRKPLVGEAERLGNPGAEPVEEHVGAPDQRFEAARRVRA